jgi:hypothetical protein
MICSGLSVELLGHESRSSYLGKLIMVTLFLTRYFKTTHSPGSCRYSEGKSRIITKEEKV